MSHQLEIHQLPHGHPVRRAEGSVGYDVCATSRLVISPGEYAEIPLGVIAKPPDGYFIMLAARSSFFRKTGLVVANGIGIIDPNYCGPGDELKLAVYNSTNRPSNIGNGDAVCQMVLVPATFAPLCLVDGPPAPRNRGGFGSTDVARG